MKLRLPLLFLSLFVFGCGGDDAVPEIVLPTNLEVEAIVNPDGSGKVDVFATATNANFFTVTFGDITNEIAQKTTTGEISHTYLNSGNYTITVKAHATETHYISTTKPVTISLATDIVTIPSTGYTTPLTYEGMSLVWNDEFEGTTLNSAYWTHETGAGGWGNNELQYYRSNNTSMVDGHLVITAKKENFSGSNYTSSRIITKDKKTFQYGRIDIRAALPKGQGIWPALWMLGADISTVGWPKCGEIDIMEMIGGTAEREKTTFGTLHWDSNGHVCTCDKPGYMVPEGSLNDRFHVFTITWDESFITWYVDDVQFNKIDITPADLSEFKNPYFFIFNVAVGGDWPKNPDASTKFPQHMIVDYVRVFQNQ